MSNINDLIQQYCPNGCEYKSLSEISDRIKGMTGVSNKWAENGNCQFIDYLNAYNHLKIDVSLRPFATVKKLEQMPLMTGDILITSASETPDECALSAVIEDEIDDNTFLDDHLFGIRIKPEYKTLVNPSYVNYYFHSKDFRKILPKAVRGVTRYYVSLPEFMELEIPVPPLPVQEEIVRILDKFTELEQELEQELELRKKQYEYYRDKMLSLSDYDGEVEWKPLSEVAKRLKGSPVTAGQMKNMAVEGGNITIFGGGATKVQTDEKHTSKFNIITVPSVLIKSRGIVDVEYCDFPYTFKQEMWAYEGSKDIDTKFLYYYLQTKVDMLRYKGSIMGSMPQIKLDDTETIMVPIIDINEQKHIVDILDKFSTLTSDIFEGLPAEIKLHHQAYEYYRDKLLNFKRLEVTV